MERFSPATSLMVSIDPSPLCAEALGAEKELVTHQAAGHCHSPPLKNRQPLNGTNVPQLTPH